MGCFCPLQLFFSGDGCGGVVPDFSLFPCNSSNRDSCLLRVCSASAPKGSAYSYCLLKFNAHNVMASWLLFSPFHRRGTQHLWRLDRSNPRARKCPNQGSNSSCRGRVWVVSAPQPPGVMVAHLLPGAVLGAGGMNSFNLHKAPGDLKLIVSNCSWGNSHGSDRKSVV